ncbi:hypothetical protein C5U62_31915 [Pseudomonas protegens]|uniref:DUF2188 domain-containing protein n=1 Tax=Pseudomonas protegens TaxID=380021 RepID=A0A2T6GBB9_9PSED|nr:hypothetical protein [Pseudomonas protegens]PUA41443.1 hypothetical protein C5U62_31915 [Pseudomonas protegens]
MSIRSLAKNLPKDPDNAGWVLGWGVVQSSPWRFIDIYASKEAAEAEAEARGPGYRVDYGSHRLGSDDFMGELEQP